MHAKYIALCDTIKQYDRVAVCLSGGSDSALVAIAATDALGPENVTAITANTAFFTGEEMDNSAHLSSVLGIPHLTPRAALLTDPQVVSNPPDRCYYCKRTIMAAIVHAAKEKGIEVVLDGSNASDANDCQPGARALEEFSIHSPLKEVGITKPEVYQLLRERKMREFIYPENACLATRIATGEPITLKKLRWIRAAENYIHQLGFQIVRVRVSNGKARVEVGREQLGDLMEMQDEIIEELKGMGYTSVEIDPRGYIRKGSPRESE